MAQTDKAVEVHEFWRNAFINGGMNSFMHHVTDGKDIDHQQLERMLDAEISRLRKVANRTIDRAIEATESQESTFTYWLGRRRVPKWLYRLLEWLYQHCGEPSRLGRDLHSVEARKRRTSPPSAQQGS